MRKRAITAILALLILVLVGTSPVLAKVKIGNVATVAPSGGDYMDPAVAMADFANWCGVPSATNPCLLKIMPGSYNVGSNSVIMHEYIDVEGSGENITIIEGAIGTTAVPRQGVIVGASNAEIRFLSVVNDAITISGDDAVAISYEFQSPKLLHVTATASGGTSTNVGVYIDHFDSNSTPLTLTHVTAKASGGMNSYGIEYVDCRPTLTNVIASASEGSVQSYGVFGSNDAGGFSTIEHSVLSGTTGSLFSAGFESTRIASTRLIGSVHVGGGGDSPTCAGVYNASFVFFASTCL